MIIVINMTGFRPLSLEQPAQAVPDRLPGSALDVVGMRDNHALERQREQARHRGTRFPAVDEVRRSSVVVAPRFGVQPVWKLRSDVDTGTMERKDDGGQGSPYCIRNALPT